MTLDVKKMIRKIHSNKHDPKITIIVFCMYKNSKDALWFIFYDTSMMHI